MNWRLLGRCFGRSDSFIMPNGVLCEEDLEAVKNLLESTID